MVDSVLPKRILYDATIAVSVSQQQKARLTKMAATQSGNRSAFVRQLIDLLYSVWEMQPSDVSVEEIDFSSYFYHLGAVAIAERIYGQRWAPWFPAPTLIDAVDEGLERLDPREARILRLHAGMGCLPLSLRKIADRFGLSLERIRQIEYYALRKLRHPRYSGRLRELARIVREREAEG